MLWQETDSLCENEIVAENNNISSSKRGSIRETNERKVKLQLEQFKDPKDDPMRNSLLEITNRFSELVLQNDYSTIDRELLSKDCLLFISDSEKETSSRYSKRLGEGFSMLYEGVTIKFNEREVLEVLVDSLKCTVMQTCKCLIWYENKDIDGGGNLKEKISCEIFSLKDHKIFKYRCNLALMTSVHGPESFALPPKDIMLAKIKQINYALADKPNFTRVAGLLDEKSEYKIWDWDEGNCSLMYPDNLEKTFEKLQANKKITRVVPFEVKAHASKVVVTYVYYLEDNANDNVKKYMWINNCVYLFDHSLNIEMISQMGELYSENEIELPFDPFSREEVQEYTMKIFRGKKPSFDLYFEGMENFTAPLTRFGPLQAPNIGVYKGLKDKDELLIFTPECIDFSIDWAQPVDMYIDYHHPCYVVQFMSMNAQFRLKKAEHDSWIGKIGNEINSTRVYLEDKCCKINSVLSIIWDKMPSSYDDQDFTSNCLVPIKEYYEKQ